MTGVVGCRAVITPCWKANAEQRLHVGPVDLVIGEWRAGQIELCEQLTADSGFAGHC
jgi:hypothetical protein